MLKKLVTVLVLLSLAFVSTCGIPDNNPPYRPHTGVAFAHEVISGPSIEIIKVEYFAGDTVDEDRAEVTISGYGWGYCERIRVYYNDLRTETFDPSGSDWIFTFVVPAIPQECSVRVEGATSGWSNYCYFDGAPPGAMFGLLQPQQKMGIVGSTAGILTVNWRPKGLVTIFFRGLPIDRLYPSPVWAAQFTVPEVPAGVWPVEVRDESNIWKFDFRVIPNLTIESVGVAPNQLITIIGTGFAAYHYVHLSGVDKLAYTNQSGSFRLDRIPAPSAGIIEGLDEENNVAQVQFAPKTPVAEAPVVVSTPTTVQIPSSNVPPELERQVNAMVYTAIGVISALVLALIIALVALFRRKRQVES